MATVKDFRNMVWQHEFDLADEEASRRAQRIERVRRTAALRASAQSGRSAQPTPLASKASRELGVVAPHVPEMTRHGQIRLRQRGITVDQVVTLLDFGSEQRSHGASRYFLDRRARARLAVEMPDALRSLTSLDIHVVLADDGRVITAAHRTKRIRRDIHKTSRPGTND